MAGDKSMMEIEAFSQLQANSPATNIGFICQEAERVRSKHSVGIQRLPLESLGYGPLNLSMSAKPTRS